MWEAYPSPWFGMRTARLPLFGSEGAWELLRIHLPRTWVNKGHEEGPAALRTLVCQLGLHQHQAAQVLESSHDAHVPRGSDGAVKNSSNTGAMASGATLCS